VGVRPSFDRGPRTVETHILDFDQDIYGCDLVVEFVARLRDERRFANIDDLVAQIGRDSEAARRILSAYEQATSSKGSGDVACRHRYREIEHTADRALWVWGSELSDLFTGAARGMYSLMADTDGLVATEWRQVRLEALDLEMLLVDWLNELLFLTEMERLLLVDYRIESLTEAASAGPVGAALVARVGGVSMPVTKASIKAATFHDLEIVRAESGWSTEITFDV
jgi:protein archease